MGLDYVDIFYSHRFDPETPLEETMGALDSAVRQGKALYVGISSYNSRRTKEAVAIQTRSPALIIFMIIIIYKRSEKVNSCYNHPACSARS